MIFIEFYHAHLIWQSLIANSAYQQHKHLRILLHLCWVCQAGSQKIEDAHEVREAKTTGTCRSELEPQGQTLSNHVSFSSPPRLQWRWPAEETGALCCEAKHITGPREEETTRAGT